jgi:hypothetical protein
MKKLKLLALLSALVLTFSLTAVASAQEDVPHHAFTGTVMLDGKPAPEGTEITALISGEVKGFARVNEPGEYGPLNVTQPTTDGKLITFTINGQLAEQSVYWEQGGVTKLDLTIDTDGRR